MVIPFSMEETFVVSTMTFLRSLSRNYTNVWVKRYKKVNFFISAWRHSIMISEKIDLCKRFLLKSFYSNLKISTEVSECKMQVRIKTPLICVNHYKKLT